MAWVAQIKEVVEEPNRIIIKVNYTDGTRNVSKEFPCPIQVFRTRSDEEIRQQIIDEGSEVKKMYERIDNIKPYIGKEITIP